MQFIISNYHFNLEHISLFLPCYIEGIPCSKGQFKIGIPIYDDVTILQLIQSSVDTFIMELILDGESQYITVTANRSQLEKHGNYAYAFIGNEKTALIIDEFNDLIIYNDNKFHAIMDNRENGTITEVDNKYRIYDNVDFDLHFSFSWIK